MSWLKGLCGYAGQSAVGIITKSPACTTIEGNKIVGMGSGVETTAYGIHMANDAEGVFGGPFGGLTIRGDTIRTASAANARGIFLCLYASGAYADLIVEGNVVDGFSYGLRVPCTGTVSGLGIRDNRFRACALGGCSFSGTPPTEGVMEGNTVGGLPYLMATAWASTPDVSGIGHLRRATPGPQRSPT